MSSLVQPQQQPVQVYPDTAILSPPPPPYHSNGSFGTVFIVLAVIVVVSAIACFLGRFCSRRLGSSSRKHFHNQKPPKQHNHRNFRPKEGDLEIGFDKKIASSKPIGLGHGHGYDMHGPGRGRGKAGSGGGRGGPKPHFNGDMKGFDMKIGHDGEFKAGV